MTNTENGRICEVTQEYNLTLKNLTNNILLTSEFYRVEGSNETKIENISGIFDAGVEQAATYKIKVTWSDAPLPVSQAFEVDALQIVVTTEQID